MISRANLDDLTTSLFSQLRNYNRVYHFDVLRCPQCRERLEALELETFVKYGKTYQHIYWRCPGKDDEGCAFPAAAPRVFFLKRTEAQMNAGYIPLPRIHLLPKRYWHLYPSVFKDIVKSGRRNVSEVVTPSSLLATGGSSVRSQSPVGLEVEHRPTSSSLCGPLENSSPKSEIDGDHSIRFVQICDEEGDDDDDDGGNDFHKAEDGFNVKPKSPPIFNDSNDPPNFVNSEKPGAPDVSLGTGIVAEESVLDTTCILSSTDDLGKSGIMKAVDRAEELAEKPSLDSTSVEADINQFLKKRRRNQLDFLSMIATKGDLVPPILEQSKPLEEREDATNGQVETVKAYLLKRMNLMKTTGQTTSSLPFTKNLDASKGCGDISNGSEPTISMRKRCLTEDSFLNEAIMLETEEVLDDLIRQLEGKEKTRYNLREPLTGRIRKESLCEAFAKVDKVIKTEIPENVSSCERESEDIECKSTASDYLTNDISSLGIDFEDITVRDYVMGLSHLESTMRNAGSLHQRTVRSRKNRIARKMEVLPPMKVDPADGAKCIKEFEDVLLSLEDEKKVFERPRMKIRKGSPTSFVSSMVPASFFDRHNWQRPVSFSGTTNLDAFVALYNLKYNRDAYLDALMSALLKHNIISYEPSVPVKQQRLIKQAMNSYHGDLENVNIEKLAKDVNPSILRLQIAHRLGLKEVIEKSHDVTSSSKELPVPSTPIIHRIASAPAYVQQGVQNEQLTNSYGHLYNAVCQRLLPPRTWPEKVEHASFDPSRDGSSMLPSLSTPTLTKLDDPETNAIVNRKFRAFMEDDLSGIGNTNSELHQSLHFQEERETPEQSDDFNNSFTKYDEDFPMFDPHLDPSNM